MQQKKHDFLFFITHSEHLFFLNNDTYWYFYSYLSSLKTDTKYKIANWPVSKYTHPMIKYPEYVPQM